MCSFWGLTDLSVSSENPRQPVDHRHPAEDRLQIRVRSERRDVPEGELSVLICSGLSRLLHGQLHFLCRCVFDPQGKGKEMTYWLTGVTGGNYNLPTPPTAWVKLGPGFQLWNCMWSSIHHFKLENQPTFSCSCYSLVLREISKNILINSFGGTCVECWDCNVPHLTIL